MYWREADCIYADLCGQKRRAGEVLRWGHNKKEEAATEAGERQAASLCWHATAHSGSGKKRMKMMGKVSVPQEAFMAVLKINSSSEDDSNSD
jgi:hypothetical protein